MTYPTLRIATHLVAPQRFAPQPSTTHRCATHRLGLPIFNQFSNASRRTATPRDAPRRFATHWTSPPDQFPAATQRFSTRRPASHHPTALRFAPQRNAAQRVATQRHA